MQWETTYCRVYITYVIIRNVFKTILYDVYISYFKLSFYITIIFRINVTPPPVNRNGFRRPGAQAFAVVLIFGLGKFNIKWVLISIVKIWSKTCTSRRSTSVFSKNGICCTCWRIFFWRIKRFERENFRFEVPCRRIDDQK